MSFASLKRGATDFEKLKKTIESTANSGAKEDARFWEPTVDKAGNGMAVIRFLPAPAADGDDGIPWVMFWRHSFQAPGGWLIDNCLTSLGQECPVCENNTELWNTEVKENRDIVSKRKRKLTYISNIYIVSDPSNPENEGKVKLFRYGKKIFDKINEAMNPVFKDETPFNPFDLWTGANFKLKMQQLDGFRNYDKSSFENPSALFDSDDKLEEVYHQEMSLKEFIDPSKFNSYDKIKDRLNKVLGIKTGAVSTRPIPQGVAGSTPQPQIPDGVQSESPELSQDDINYFQSFADE
jgi:hypothetical protein